MELRWKQLQTWADLTDVQQMHVRQAFEQGRFEAEFLLKSAELIQRLKALQAGIKVLSEDERKFLLSDDERAILYEGGRLKRTHLQEVEDAIDQHLTWMERPGRGAPRNLARLYCVAELRRIWVEAGGSPAPGRRHEPNPFVRFLGDCLSRVDPHLKDEKLARDRAHYELLTLREIQEK